MTDGTTKLRCGRFRSGFQGWVCADERGGGGVWYCAGSVAVAVGRVWAAKQERVKAGAEAGYEIVDGGFALSGPKYYARFRDACLEMVHEVGREPVQV